jgi:hypothetical protein
LLDAQHQLYLATLGINWHLGFTVKPRYATCIGELHQKYNRKVVIDMNFHG